MKKLIVFLCLLCAAPVFAADTALNGFTNITESSLTINDELVVWNGGGVKNIIVGDLWDWYVANKGLASFTNQTAWRIFYSDGSGDVKELALGADGEYLKSNGASSVPSWGTPTGAAHDAVTLSTDLGNNLLGLSTQQLTLDSQTSNYVFAAPNGSSGVPSFRALVSDDIPSLSATYAVIAGTPSTTFQIDNDATGPKLKNSSGNLEVRNAGDTAYANITADKITFGSMESSAADGSHFGNVDNTAAHHTSPTPVNGDFDSIAGTMYVYRSSAWNQIWDALSAPRPVSGPSSAPTDGALVAFDGTTGRLVKQGTAIGTSPGNIMAVPTDPAANVLWGWDDTDNAMHTISLGANLSYDHATYTLSASGSGMSWPAAAGIALYSGSSSWGTSLSSSTASHYLRRNAANDGYEFGALPISDTAYDASSWDTSTDAPTKNAVRDKIETLAAASHTHTYTESFVVKSPADADDFLLLKAPAALTITSLNCVAQVTTSGSITAAIQECDGDGANCADGGISLTADGSNDSDTSFTDASIASGNWLKVVLGAPTGTVNFVSCTLSYTR